MKIHVDGKRGKRPITGTATVEILVDPPVDSDGDGMPDYWETQYQSYGFDPGVWNDPDADTDGDGCSDSQECKAGTGPTDPLSKPSSDGHTSSTRGCAPGAGGGAELVLIVIALACTGRRDAARFRGSPSASA